MNKNRNPRLSKSQIERYLKDYYGQSHVCWLTGGIAGDDTEKPRSDRPRQAQAPRRQRRLTGLGFDTKVNGKFDKPTRAVITRWQVARGYPGTGFLNQAQHQALLTESISVAQASIGGDQSDDDRKTRRRGSTRHRGGGPGGLVGGVVGGVVGGLFGRR